MGCRGVHFALSPQGEQLLLQGAEAGDEAVLNVLQEDIEQRWDEEWLQQTDKAWDAIHRCLTDGTLTTRATSPRGKCILAGRQLHRGRDYIISYLTAAEVKQVAEAISVLDKPWMRNRYFRLDEDDYGLPLSEEDFEYTWEYFELLQQFFAKAAAANRSIVFTADQ